MKILFVYQDSSKSIYFESLTHHLRQKSIEIESLFFCPKGYLQEKLEAEGAPCFNYISKKHGFIAKMIENARFLIQFSKKNKFDIIFSHLGNANLYATLAHFFLKKTKVIVCRHNADESYITNNKKAIFFDKFINRFAPKIVVVSPKAQKHLIEVEKAKPEKVVFLPLVYDFERYELESVPTLQAVEQVKSDLKVITISRLILIKRIDAFFPVIQHFKEKNKRISFQIIGEGDLRKDFEKQVADLDIADCVQFLGHQENVMPHIQAADVLVHLSISESSNQVVKEAGYCGKTVIACKGVGDFDTYLTEKNAYLLEKDFKTEDIIKIIEEIINPKSNNTEGVLEKGERLKKDVLDKFSFSEKIINDYLKLFDISYN